MTTASHFEALKIAFRQTKDGVVISLAIHPNEVSPALMALPIGSRVMIGWCEIGEDEKPKGGDVDTKGTRSAGTERPDKTPPQAALKEATPGARFKRAFRELSMPQQCALTCGDWRFWNFIAVRFGVGNIGATDAARIIREHCGIASRAALSTNHDAANKWRALESEYQNWLATQAYAESVR